MDRADLARRASLLLPAALLLALCSGCGHPPLPAIEVEQGPTAEVTPDGLHRAHHVGYQDVWLKPDADFRVYDAVLLEPISVAYKRKPTSTRYRGTDSNFPLTETQMADFKRYFRQAFLKELEALEYWRVTEQPGPKVLRIEAAVIDLVIKVPTDPRTASEKVFTTSTGEMTLLLELHDSLSGEILARVAEHSEARAAGHGGLNDLYYSSAVTNSDAVRRVFRRWAQILAARLDEVHAAPPRAALAE